PLAHAARGCARLHLPRCFDELQRTVRAGLALHDALPISPKWALSCAQPLFSCKFWNCLCTAGLPRRVSDRSRMSSRQTSCTQTRSEEHTSELQSRFDLVCRLLLAKKKTLARATITPTHSI